MRAHTGLSTGYGSHINRTRPNEHKKVRRKGWQSLSIKKMRPDLQLATFIGGTPLPVGPFLKAQYRRRTSFGNLTDEGMKGLGPNQFPKNVNCQSMILAS